MFSLIALTADPPMPELSQIMGFESISESRRVLRMVGNMLPAVASSDSNQPDARVLMLCSHGVLREKGKLVDTNPTREF
ncbi:MAG: hypothetical protein ACC628_01015 [Pirellulaceae bacterium]